MEDKIKSAVEQILNEKDTRLCEKLIRSEGINSPEFAKAALEAGIFRPNVLYCSASDDVRDRLIEMLEEDKIENIDGCLMALAAIGDDVVAEYFKKWDKDKYRKEWKNKLYLSPIYYAEEGGWHIDKDKNVKLYFSECYALEKVSECNPDKNIYRGRDEERCPACGNKLINFIIDGRDTRLSFLGINGRIKIKLCLDCLPYEEALYCRYEEDGESKLICDKGNKAVNIEDDEEDNIDYLQPLIISEKRVSKNYCDEFTESAIGGMPCFIDDATYMDCPDCGKKMKHFMQIGEDYTGGGTIYFQICTDCKVTAAIYQQT